MTSRKLHIGGIQRTDGWEILNAVSGPHVDHLCNARDLSMFEDNTFSDVYASHVLEHFDYIKELSAVLGEWYRVLKPGGTLYVSVPDLDILTSLFIARDRFTIKDRFIMMQMMFGGHINKYDYHQVGLNQEFLQHFLCQAGYTNIQRVNTFGFFNDTSTVLFNGIPISLNVKAEKTSITSKGVSSS